MCNLFLVFFEILWKTFKVTSLSEIETTSEWNADSRET